MNRFLRCLVFTVVFQMLGLSALLAADNSPRQTLNFNRDWKFQLGDYPGAEAVKYDDAKWDAANLPHSFSTPYFQAPGFYMGYGWYRKHFDVPSSWDGKRLFIEFEAAYQEAEVFVNSKRVGYHQGGYTGFSVDITDAVKTGDNVVSVRVNNKWNAQFAPRAGEHVFSGGIYRDAWLVVTDPLHVTWYGSFVTTPDVSAESGKVNVKTEITNQSKVAKQCELKTDIVDANGKVVATVSSAQSIAAGTTVTLEQNTPAVAKPQLWHPDHPNLYRAVSTVLDGKKEVDRFETTFGFRWFKWTADQGFFLNGEHYYIRGANVHQDHAGWGDAVTNSGFERDVKLVKDAGFEFIRGSHYPHDPAFADACDKQGVLFWSENAFWGTTGFRSPYSSSAYPTKVEEEAGFKQSVRNGLREMIRINRNHPSIVVWSMCNEPFFSDGSVIPKVGEFLKELVAYSHELDPTRPAAIGGCQRPTGNTRIDKLGDIAGYNGDGASMREFQNPGVPSFVSEYGSTMLTRPGKYEPGWDALATKDIHAPQRPAWRSGESIWCAFDHGSLAGVKFGSMGMLDYFRLPKRAWYWYRNEYKKIPPPEWPAEGTPAKLGLTADKTTLKSVDGTDDTHLIVSIQDASGKQLSNVAPVTLSIESGPGEFPTGSSITFEPTSDIVIRDGLAAIEFRSYYAGTTVIKATSPGLTDATIKIVSQGSPAYVKGKTPDVKPRPYTRFSGSTTQQAPAVSAFGLNNPTRTSGAAPDHSAGLANDGNPDTFWQANNNEANAWVQIDLERIVKLTKTKMVFQSEGNYAYKIELSEDGAKWDLAVDKTTDASTEKVRTDTVSKTVSGRFLRITFTGLPSGKPAALSEITAFGSL